MRISKRLLVLICMLVLCMPVISEAAGNGCGTQTRDQIHDQLRIRDQIRISDSIKLQLHDQIRLQDKTCV